MAPKLSLPPNPPSLPLILQKRSSEEYSPLPYTPLEQRIVEKVRHQGPKDAARLSTSLGDYWSSRQGTAAALRELDEAFGGGFYNVPPEAALDREAADAALGGKELIIDVQTHYVANRRAPEEESTKFIFQLGNSVAPARFKGLDKLAKNQTLAGYSLAEYLRCIYLESETAVAVLSSAPGDEARDVRRILHNAEMIGTRELIDRFAGSGRLINHVVVHPNIPGEVELMSPWSEWCKPAGWKVYTMYGAEGTGQMKWSDRAWFLDDEESGLPFLDRVMETGAMMVCAHKGISDREDVGWSGPASPRDIGPVAKGYPDINFIVYHSGYEPRDGAKEEGPYSEEVSNSGTNRLIKSLKNAGIGPGSNVYAELGTSWYLMMANPREAAHVMGKLLSAFGEDNILWGTDCIWYGSPQPLIDTFRAFQIPQEFSQRYGYPQLTPTTKEKILGLNAAQLYGMDPEKVRTTTSKDDLAWVKAAMEEYRTNGTPSVQ